MLVLTRKPGEQIIIADNIRLTVISVGPGRVKIGIEAPPSIKVDRQEIHDKKKFETAPAPTPLTDVAPPHIVESAPTLYNRIAAKLPTTRRFPPRKPR